MHRICLSKYLSKSRGSGKAPKAFIHIAGPFILLASFPAHTSLFADSSTERLLTDTEAAAIITEDANRKSLQSEARENALQSADILDVAIADLGDRKVIFNRVTAPTPSPENVDTSAPLQQPGFTESEFSGSLKERVHVTLSGTTYADSITELWWAAEGRAYRIFTNTDLSVLGGLAHFEDETTRYSLFTTITPFRETQSVTGEWKPQKEDFSPGSIEYIITEWGGRASIDYKDFEILDALLQFYSENEETLRIRHENALKISAARKTYQQANPEAARDTIINFRPIE